MAFLTKLLFQLVFRPQEKCIHLKEVTLKVLPAAVLVLQNGLCCTCTAGECCWWHWIAKEPPRLLGRLWPTLYPTFLLLPWFSSSAFAKRVLLLIVWCFLMAKAQGKISILPLYCPNAILRYFAFLSSKQENTRVFLLSLCGTAFFTVQSRDAVLPLHLYFFIASWIFHVETLMRVIFCLCIHFSFFASKLRLF